MLTQVRTEEIYYGILEIKRILNMFFLGGQLMYTNVRVLSRNLETLTLLLLIARFATSVQLLVISLNLYKM